MLAVKMLPLPLTIFFLACLWIAPAPNSAFEDDWMSSGDENISQKAQKNESERITWVIIENEAVIDAPIKAVAIFLKDVQKTVAMIPGLRSKVILKDVSANDRIDYDHYKLAWPIKDRYLIYHARQEYDRGNEILLTMDSIDDYPYEDGGKIRGTIRNSYFLLQSLPDNPSRTRVQIRMRIDPGGWLPSWFLNTQTKNWSGELLNNLQKDIRKNLAKETRLRPATHSK